VPATAPTMAAGTHDEIPHGRGMRTPVIAPNGPEHEEANILLPASDDAEALADRLRGGPQTITAEVLPRRSGDCRDDGLKAMATASSWLASGARSRPVSPDRQDGRCRMLPRTRRLSCPPPSCHRSPRANIVTNRLQAALTNPAAPTSAIGKLSTGPGGGSW
jgi:hypothetical protein